MRSLEELLKAKRMFYLPESEMNSVGGLLELVAEIVKPDFTIVEIGSFAGVSSDVFARYCKKLYCVDIWTSKAIENGIEDAYMEKGERYFDDVWYQHTNIIPLQALSVDAAAGFRNGNIDMVYIDGNHEYESVKADILAWLPKIRKGGWITGHDMGLAGVKEAVEEVLGTNYKTYKDTSWSLQI